jgi:hypothetical protein
MLIKDLSLQGNRLPEALKAQLIGLGLWSMRYSTLAILNKLPLEPLIEVNRNIADGIAQQASHPAAGPPPTGQVGNQAGGQVGGQAGGELGRQASSQIGKMI